MNRNPKTGKKPGFTLLELMIAIFILALAVTILLGTESTSMRMMGYANNTSVVTMLTRAKMQDLEYEVQQQIKKDGVEDEYLETLSGDFGEQGYDDIEWEALIQSIRLSDEASNNFTEEVEKQIYGTGDEAGTLSGNTTVTQFLPQMIQFFPAIINQLGQRIRKITLTTTWDYLGVEQTLTVSQFVVILDVGENSEVSGSSVSGNTNANGETIDVNSIDTGNAGGGSGNSGSNSKPDRSGSSNKPGGSGGSNKPGGSGGNNRPGGSGNNRPGGSGNNGR